MSSSKPAPIAIVGGGPCGLTLARLLERAGIDYVVFERDVSPQGTARFQGGTLDLSAEGGQAALNAAGLSAEFEKLARYESSTIFIQDWQGKNQLSEGGGESDRPEIDRLQLRQILLDSIPAHRVRWNKSLSSVERINAKKTQTQSKSSSPADWLLHFNDGSTESGFRLIVGSDGGWSKLRQLITSAKPQYSGKMFIEGCISLDNPEWDAAFKMVGAGNSIAMGNGLSLAVQQMSDRSYRVYMGVEASPEFTRPGGDADVNDMPKARETINRLYSNWAPHLRGFVAGAEGPWRPWLLHRMNQEIYLPDALRNDGKVDEKSWTRTPGVVLLGDAAHVTTPNGEGVNDAMNDAKLLFEHITAELANDAGQVYDAEIDSATLERAIVAYEGQMRPHAYEMIQDSINFEDMMYKEDGPQRMQVLFHSKEEQNEASKKH
ncbi:FAD/NAD(P)-binding domain-containing protein [Penicillium angulare]|uniref:FAD/NAD(P)-binding domain-containing protein n=1 Tax=Penicillium angulare TaxID=116970 RepID=UPI002540155D|nr:FAD/NAD(P)-binding domain-containing protein [Penicillium angulare]KAJ5281620.1 FAD/NAD(P)-binding domain-containing protein [Penicillium angulare]